MSYVECKAGQLAAMKPNKKIKDKTYIVRCPQCGNKTLMTKQLVSEPNNIVYYRHSSQGIYKSAPTSKVVYEIFRHIIEKD